MQCASVGSTEHCPTHSNINHVLASLVQNEDLFQALWGLQQVNLQERLAESIVFDIL